MNPVYFIRGYSHFVIKCDKPMKMISELRNKVVIRNMKAVVDNTVEFYCFYSGKKNVQETVNNMNAEIVSQKHYGFPYLVCKYKKRIGLLFSCIAVFALLFISKMFVWEISVEGNDKISDNDIIKTLNEIGFSEGTYKYNIDMDSLINNFLIKEKRISWIAVNLDGTVAHVEVREGNNPLIKTKNENVNLVASHDGIVLRADVLEGGTMVKKGDVVYRGQLLVSAFIDRNDKSTLRGARGSVWAKTEHEISVSTPLSYYEKEYSGKIKKRYCLFILGKKLTFGGVKHGFEMSEKDEKIIKAETNTNLRLPFEIMISSHREYTLVSKRRTEKQALEISRKQALIMLKKTSPTFVSAETEEYYEVVDGVVEYKCVFSGVENIAEPLEFEMS